MLPLQRITPRKAHAVFGKSAGASAPFPNGPALPTSEAAMVEAVESTLRSALERKVIDWTMRREVPVGRSVADLVVLLGGTKGPDLLRGPLSVTESVLFSCVQRLASRDFNDLAVQCGLSKPDAARRPLMKLAREGWLSIDRNGRVSTPSEPAASRIVAIEAKLTRWREALTQAEGYLRFADAAYVILPAAGITGALRNLDAFTSAGVGLLVSVGDDRTFELLKPKRNRRHDWQRAFVLSRLLATSAH